MRNKNDHPSDSIEQQHAETVIADLLENLLGFDLERNKKLHFLSSSVNVDLFCMSPAVLGEIYAHIGKLKPPQINKLVADALKMQYIQHNLKEPFRKLMVICDDEVYSTLIGDSWKSCVIRELGIEIVKIDIPEELKATLINAQKRQYR